jgi:hypothetical protein
LGIEFWQVNARRVEIKNCDFDTQLSLEKDPPKNSSDFVFWVHHNKFAVQFRQALELAASNSVVEYNFFDVRETENPWCLLGEFNCHDAGGSNIHFRRNYIELQNYSGTTIWVLRNAAKDIFFYNNTIHSEYEDGGRSYPAMFNFRAPHSLSHSENVQVFNNIFDLGSDDDPFRLATYINDNDPDNPNCQKDIITPEVTLFSYYLNFNSRNIGMVPTNAYVQDNIKREIAGLKVSGIRPLPYYQYNNATGFEDAGSLELPATPNGIPAFQYFGLRPDIGAFEKDPNITGVDFSYSDKQFDFYIAPNVVNESSTYFMIKSSNNTEEEIINLSIYSIDGQMISSRSVHANDKISLDKDLAKGLYLIHLEQSGKKEVHKLLVR